MRTAGSNHKDFDSKKEALAFLKKNALMSVGWKEGNKDKVAIYWNGRLHVEDAKTKKIWGSEMDKQKVARELVEVAKDLTAASPLDEFYRQFDNVSGALSKHVFRRFSDGGDQLYFKLSGQPADEKVMKSAMQQAERYAESLTKMADIIRKAL